MSVLSASMSSEFRERVCLKNTVEGDEQDIYFTSASVLASVHPCAHMCTLPREDM